MEQFRNLLDKILEVLCSVILTVMVLIVLFQIFTRVVLNNPNTVTEEIVRFSLVWLSMLSAAYVVGKRSHLAVTLLSDKLNLQNRKILDLIVQILFLVFSLLIMVYGGLKSVSVTLVQYSPSLGLPMGYVYLAVPVAGCLIFLYTLINLSDVLKGAK
ncbi:MULTISPECIES: TRAP transporter small permease [unclassified Facklamia]|uniref:TRAP transporter small permease n=1 Tax=Aerococcaceae TaxID=186827 RepID=UPI0013BC4106|nr:MULTISPECIES: TRAP transporter small permease [unclassified Facklamia]NEW65077.1 TRAP transporter small permease subunit [Facklamia sp. 252]NEW68681.1 TRAP transporter small permease subunit [Facklamia sp. 253]QQD65475.1 TRAP transporter small permease [Aerococcaceae bacterium zg-252]